MNYYIRKEIMPGYFPLSIPPSPPSINIISEISYFIIRDQRFGAEERRLMNLVPAPAVKLMKGRVLSRPGRKKCPSICPVICILRIMISSSFTYRIKIINTIILEFGTFGHILVTEFHFLNLMFSYFIRIEFLVSL